MLLSLELIMKANRYKIWNDELRPRVNFYKKNTHRQFHSNSMAGKRKPLTSLDRCLPSIFPATFAPTKKNENQLHPMTMIAIIVDSAGEFEVRFRSKSLYAYLVFLFPFYFPLFPQFPIAPAPPTVTPSKSGAIHVCKTHARPQPAATQHKKKQTQVVLLRRTPKTNNPPELTLKAIAKD